MEKMTKEEIIAKIIEVEKKMIMEGQKDSPAYKELIAVHKRIEEALK